MNYLNLQFRDTVSAPVANEQGSALPYIFGWLLGVPVSLLMLIALVRAVF